MYGERKRERESTKCWRKRASSRRDRSVRAENDCTQGRGSLKRERKRLEDAGICRPLKSKRDRV